MKKIALLIFLCVAGWSMSVASPPPGGVSFGVFYSSLSPYGEWISVGADLYGWRPNHVASDWRPYTYGQWEWTDDGWYWTSDEPWGWAAYHYGRWYYDDYYGWVWIPGYDWAPAWVEWRYGGDYIGWAPLSPYAVFSVSFGIHYRTHWVTPNRWWSFVDAGHMGYHDVHRYVFRNDQNPRFIGRTRDVGSVRYDGGRVVSRGPDRGEVEKRGNVHFNRAEIVDVNDRQGERVVRGTDNREKIETYRPRISAGDNHSATERPASVRQGDRPLNIDSRGLDARSREEDIARGRDLRQSESYRQQRDLQMQQQKQQQNQAKNADPTVHNNNAPGRPDRTIDRAPVPTKREAAQPQPTPRVQQRDQTRSRAPERVMRRPANQVAPSTRRAPQSEAPRSAGGGGQRSGGGSGRSGGGQSSGSRGEGGHRR